MDRIPVNLITNLSTTTAWMEIWGTEEGQGIKFTPAAFPDKVKPAYDVHVNTNIHYAQPRSVPEWFETQGEKE